jgi:hypothetical protein
MYVCSIRHLYSKIDAGKSVHGLYCVYQLIKILRMKTQTILFITGIALVVVLAILFMSRPEEKTTPNTISGTDKQTVQTNSETVSGIKTVQTNKEKASGLTRAEVSNHASREDCYTIIGDKVYNVTSWIAKHPGGAEAILGLCGKDGTVPFTEQHGGTAKAQTTLATFFIANLIN